ncbi:hypothetical protein B0H63DRAFT_56375 [Podospora didyma]|uniref:Secreted protein n=1 Tax=Podospora didyma TaxID=330526 RepID=A0AAE0U8R7_9PEZI|nr:hypothetical protein B0H63DRAFT_56375 [Podospora didyma]
MTTLYALLFLTSFFVQAPLQGQDVPFEYFLEFNHFSRYTRRIRMLDLSKIVPELESSTCSFLEQASSLVVGEGLRTPATARPPNSHHPLTPAHSFLTP